VNNCPAIDPARLRAAYHRARTDLLAERTPDGHWVGQLSSSALSTATAISALAVAKPTIHGRGQNVQADELISQGIAWLVKQQNSDGGFGDTDLSHSNIATTYLVVAALHLAGMASEYKELLDRANGYIAAKGGLQGLRERYGIDKTFVVPIMTNLALAGLVEWREIDTLPFELACVPQSWYRFVGMPVVSYAIPALVAIGQAQFCHAPPRNPILRLIRWLSISRSLNVLRLMQPESGGYLEATPLTSFVVMSLASAQVQSSKFKVEGSLAEQVIREGVRFLVNSVRPDGSWPIDTNLATWNTTLAINALAGGGENVTELIGSQCLEWLLSCQHTRPHPFTGATPGGFGWSDLSGAVPDADDTPSAMLAINSFSRRARNGLWAVPDTALSWLLRLQNADGGWPTFCRGWGKLPFDRSGVDLTAHALRAIVVSFKNKPDIHKHFGSKQGLRFIEQNQHSDGSWSPLWFGNQDHPTEDNPLYGTAKVLMAYRDLGLMDAPEAQRGIAWLVANQNDDGGWGSGVWGKVRNNGLAELVAGTRVQSIDERVLGTESNVENLKSSIEETALAIEALLAAVPESLQPPTPSPAHDAVEKGLNWLINRVEADQHRQPAPIGFYFAKLWYYERLYPLTFTVAALGRACRQFDCRKPTRSPAIPAETAPSDAQ
jgi:squalene-hopene/tetraprenyl-beta-curcumene cyclase